MKPRPSKFSKSYSLPLAESLGLPVLKVTAKPAPSAKEKRRADIAYGIDSLDKAVEAFDHRQRDLKRR